ncbi:uncharacterized protein N7498_006832 [Penicillium cinerascens]|uniref:Uncharacterized protein n=1 Tax=Penicillium cinerascens TaxID=70096 RepID=A0A9W9JMK9_9EURO|nr:uncharacterized protein N7498_006832 [Penicillium cinerascens]KAJ5197715.1 hypothetical protein N7498_006832 [Penicillium cinerascens]
MASPEYSTVPVLETNIPFLANSIYAAKLSLSVNPLVFESCPNEALQKEIYTRILYSELSIECFKAIGLHSNEIIGYFVLSRQQPAKESLIDSDNEDSQQAILDGFNSGLLREVMKAITQIAK